MTDDRVWMIKTNHPALTISAAQVPVKKLICLVRNPLEVVSNFAKSIQTMSPARVEIEYQL